MAANDRQAEDKGVTTSSLITLLIEVVHGDTASHNLVFRFLVALWGCLVLHIAILAVGTAQGLLSIGWLELDVFGLYLLFSVIAYSCIFAAIVAFGIKKGSLVRHFVYGATLPTFTYLVAGFVSALLREG